MLHAKNLCRAMRKADGEPALQALVNRAMGVARVELKDLDQLAKEDPAAYDSQSNGGVETGIRLVRGLFRTVKLCLEQRLDKSIPIDHPVVAWMLRHACLILNTLTRGEDGISAWARVRGRAFRQQLVGFGETILYRHPSKGPRHAPDGNMGELGSEGVFIGYDRGANTFIVATDSGWVHARSISRVQASERWNSERLAKISAVPGTGFERKVRHDTRFKADAPDKAPTAENECITSIRRLRINQSDLDKHGYHQDCPQCKHIRRHGKARAGITHSDACRKQMIEALSQTEEGRARLQAQEERDQRTGVDIQEQQRERQQAEASRPEHREVQEFLPRVAGEGGGHFPQEQPSSSTGTSTTISR